MAPQWSLSMAGEYASELARKDIQKDMQIPRNKGPDLWRGRGLTHKRGRAGTSGAMRGAVASSLETNRQITIGSRRVRIRMHIGSVLSKPATGAFKTSNEARKPDSPPQGAYPN